MTSLDTEVTKTNSEKKLRTGSTHSEETHEVAKEPTTHTTKKTSDKNVARTSTSFSTVGSIAAILKEITSTQQALVEGMTSGFSQIAKLLNSRTGESSSGRKRHIDDDQIDASSGLGSREIAKRPRRDAMSDSESEDLEINSFIKEHSSNDSLDGEADIMI